MAQVALTQIIAAPQSLWNNEVPTNIQVFNDLSSFSITPKTYGTGTDLEDESTFNKNKVDGKFGNGFFYTHYAGQVSAWMQSMGKNNPNGVQTFSTGELNTLVDSYIVNQAPSNAKFVIVDFEPSNPSQDAWMWDYSDANFQTAMNYIAQRISTTHNKYFYDWFSTNVSFTFGGESYNLDGENNDGFANNLTNTSNVDKLLAVHRNIPAVSNLRTGVINQIGIGYTAHTYNPGFNGEGYLPVTKWQGVENMVLKSIDGHALKHKLSPTIKTVGYYWPLEDKPASSPGRRSNTKTKFKPNSITNSYPQNLDGKVTVTDNRTPYPSNIVEDTVLFNLCFPDLIHDEYWKHGGSYNPYAQIRYSSVNGSPNSCMGGTFKTGNYQGSEGSLPCPTNLEDYISTENRTVGAFIKAHYRYGSSGIKDVLNGTQTAEFFQFQYKRFGESSYNTSIYENHTGQAALAFKHSQPLLWVWVKPSTGERVILFWDLFADAFAPTDFKIVIGNNEYTGSTKGNRLYTSYLATAPGIITTTIPVTTTTVSGSLELVPCIVLDNYLNSNNGEYSGNYIAKIFSNNTYYQKNAGVDYNSVTMTADSPLSIMSCTKTITSAVIFKLKELGLLDLNTSISTYLPSFIGYGTKANITLKMILGHTSGIPADTPYEQNTELTIQSAANAIGQNSTLVHPPGTAVSYSSAAFQLAAAVAEIVTGQSFKSLVNQHIFIPLGITNYYWTNTPNLGLSDSSVANPIAGYGLTMSLNQYLKFVKSLAGQGTQILNSTSRSLILTDATGGLQTQYGYGLIRRNTGLGNLFNGAIFEGASGCVAWLDLDTGYYGGVWTTDSGAQTTTKNFADLVHNQFESCIPDIIGGGSLNPAIRPFSERKVVWNFDGLTGVMDSGLYDAVKNRVQVISYLNFEWGQIERTQGVFNYDEIDWLLWKLNSDGLKTILWFKTQIPTGDALSGWDTHNKVSNGVYTRFQLGASGTKYLPDSSYDIDRYGVKVNGNGHNLNLKASFAYYNTFARTSYFNFVARVCNYINNHPLKGVIEGIGMLDGGLGETAFELQNRVGTGHPTPVTDSGYHDDNIAAYRVFLGSTGSGRYANIAALNSSWGTSFGSFADINKDNMPKTADMTYDMTYNEGNGQRDWYRFKAKTHRDFYIQFCNVVKNPSSQIGGLASNTGFNTFAYVSENFSSGQGRTYGIALVRYMYEMFDCYLSSVTSGDGPNHTGSFLGDVQLRNMLLLGTFGNKPRGQEQDGDPVDRPTGQSRTAKCTFDMGAKYSVVALQTEASHWERNVLGDDNVTRKYKDDVLRTRDVLCIGQVPNSPTAGIINYFDADTLISPHNPTNVVAAWKSATNIDSNSNGVMSSPVAINCISNLV